MSSEVDRRIVELRFDNAQFAAAVKSTMSQLDILEKQLALKNATEGLTKVENKINRFSVKGAINSVGQFFAKFADKLPFVNIAAIENRFNNFKNSGAVKAIDDFISRFRFHSVQDEVDKLENNINSMNLSEAERAVLSLEKRFSTLGIVGMTALQNITTAAMNIVSSGISRVISPIVSGGYQRAQSVENATFTLKGLIGTDEAALKQIADIRNAASASVADTAYGLDQAFSAAAQFAASGIKDAATMENILKGVAGTAATVNADYSEIAHIFTVISGNGRVLTQQLNQLSYKGMNAAAILTKGFNEVLSGAVPTEGPNSIPEQVQESMRKAVEYGMKEVKDFNGTMDGIVESDLRALVTAGEVNFGMFSSIMSRTFGDHAKDAQKTFTGSMANVQAALKRIGQNFYEDIIVEEGPVTQFFGSLRDAINQINTISKPFAKAMASIVNSVASVAKVFTDTFIGNGGFEAIGWIFDDIMEVGALVGQAFQSIFGIEDFVGWIAQGTGRFRDFMYSVSIAGTEVTRFGQILEAIMAVGKLFMDILGVIGHAFFGIIDAIAPITDGFMEIIGALSLFVTDGAKAINKTDELTNGLDRVLAVVEEVAWAIGGFLHNVAENIEKFHDIISDNGLLKAVQDFANGIKNAWTFIADGSGPISEEFSDELGETATVFDRFRLAISKTIGKIKDSITGFFKSIISGELTSKFIESIKSTFNKVIDWFKSIPSKVTEAVENIKGTFPVFTEIFSGISNTEPIKKVQEFLSGIGTAFSNFVQNGGFIGSAVGSVTSGIAGGFDKFIEWVSGIGSNVGSNLNSVKDGWINFITDFQADPSSIFSYVDTISSKLGGFFSGIGNWFINDTPIGKVLSEFADTINNRFISPMSRNLPTLAAVASGISSFMYDMRSKVSSVIDVVGPIISRRLESLGRSFGTFISSVPWPTLGTIGSTISHLLGAIGTALGAGASGLGIITGRIITLLGQLITGSTDMFGTFENAVNNFAGNTESGRKFLAFFDLLKEKLEPVIKVIGDIREGVATKLAEFWSVITGMEAPTFSLADFVAGLAGAVGNLKNVLSEWWGAISQFFEPIVNWFKDQWGKFTEALNQGKIDANAVLVILVGLWAFYQIITALKTIGTGLSSVAKVPSKIATAIDDIKKTLTGEKLGGPQKLTFIQNIFVIAGALALAVYAISKIVDLINNNNPLAIIGALVIIGIIIGALVAIVLLMKKSAYDIGKGSGAEFTAMAKSLLMVSASIYIIMSSIAKIASATSGGWQVAGAIIGLVGVLAVLYFIINEFIGPLGKMSHYINAKMLMKLAIDLILVAVAIRIIADGISDMTASVDDGWDVAGLALSLLGVIAIMEYMLLFIKQLTKSPINGKKILAAAVGMILVSVAARIIISGLKDIAQVVKEDKGLGNVIGALFIVAAIMAMLGVVGKLAENFSFSGGAGLVAAAYAVKMITDLLLKLDEMNKTENGSRDYGPTWTAIAQVSVLLLALGAFGKLAENFTFGSGLGFRLVASAVDLLISLAAKVGEFMATDPGKFLTGLGIIIGVIVVLGALVAAFTWFISKTGENAGYEAAAALAGAAVALIAVAAVMYIVQGLDTMAVLPNLAMAVVALALLAVVMIAIMRFSKTTSGMVAAAAALVLASIALGIIAAVMHVISGIEWKDAVPTLIGLLGSLLLLGAALVLIGKFGGVNGTGALIGAAAMLLASLALIPIALTLALLSNMDLEKSALALVAALLVLAVAIGILGAIGGGVPALLASGALLVGALALVVLGGALVVAAIGLSMLIPPLTALSALDLATVAVNLGYLASGLIGLGAAAAIFGIGFAVGIIAAVVGLAALVVAGGIVMILLLELIPIIFGVSVALQAVGLAAESIGVGFANGINAATGAIASAVEGFCNFVANAFTGFFGIHSPSILAKVWGMFTGEGFSLGLESTEGEAGKAAEGVGLSAIGGLIGGSEGGFDIGSLLGDKFADGALSKLGKSGEAGEMNIQSALSGLMSGGDGASSAGEDLMSKFAGGAEGFDIKSIMSGIGGDAGDSLMSSFGEGAEGFDIQSMMSQMGIDSGEALGDGDMSAFLSGQGLDSSFLDGLLSGNSGDAAAEAGTEAAEAMGGEQAQAAAEASGETVAKKMLHGLSTNVQDTLHQTVQPIGPQVTNETQKSIQSAINEKKDWGFGKGVQSALNKDVEMVDPKPAAEKLAEKTAADTKQATVDKMPGIGAFGADSFLGSFGDQAASKAGTAAEKIFTAFHNTVPDYAGTGRAHAEQYTRGFQEGASGMQAIAVSISRIGYEALNQGAISYKPVGEAAGRAYSLGLDSTARNAYIAAGQILGSAQKRLNDVSGYTKAGVNASSAYAAGLGNITAIYSVHGAASRLASAAVSGLDNVSAAYSIGRNFTQGFIEGINSNATRAYATAQALAINTMNTLKSALNEQSPSKETMLMGEYFTEGFAIGIESASYMATRNAENLGKISMDTLSNALSLIDDIDYDFEPVITPVLDLSSVNAGFNQISNMLNASTRIPVAAEVAHVSAPHMALMGSLNRLQTPVSTTNTTNNYMSIDGDKIQFSARGRELFINLLGELEQMAETNAGSMG